MAELVTTHRSTELSRNDMYLMREAMEMLIDRVREEMELNYHVDQRKTMSRCEELRCAMVLVGPES